MPKLCTVDLTSISPYSASRQHEAPKLEGESAGDYDRRTWRQKCTVNHDGRVIIPGMALKMAIDAAAKGFLGRIPGAGKATWTKKFLSGVLCETEVDLGLTPDEVESITLQVNPQGQRGGAGRVPRTFPVVSKWSGTAVFVVLNDEITRDVFERAVTMAGRFIGVGRFRPEVGGFNGRFQPSRFDWQEI